MRPSLHFTARSGWINDPHGITWRDGEYHAFFQYVPDRVEWAPSCHWGHASGPDLLSLQERAVVLAPGDGDDGIWTGCLVVDGDDLRIFYTAITEPDFGIGRVRVATPDAGLDGAWVKGEVVVTAPTELDLIAFRDPFIRRDGDGWRMFVGAAGRDGTAMALTWTSPDLRAWRYTGVALQRSTELTEPVWMGALWECPQFVTLDGGDIMISSVWDADILHYAGYAVGGFDGDRFDAEAWGRLTYGDGLYAPSLFFDAEGAACLQFWIRGVGDHDAGWEGAHSVPYRLGLEGSVLTARPHPDVARHRGPLAVDGRVAGLAADIEWSATSGRLTVRSGGAEAVTVDKDDTDAVVRVGTQQWTVPVGAAVRIILDGPVFELSSEAGVFSAVLAPLGDDLHVETTAGTTVVYPLS
ncbi:glycoside hydrolase family 32 protein [Microbacterium sp. IEGM 1404]|uniref:glycoside hydrolase family 32 protein n=1 Tax=Microbacterium sp. IEGM 1404 TaxID=3047084 RepID=UPI0024B79897|nr:glycoside hydrolase family 32 protein [Microbacterium sp. IEGM 1404]MDI9892596.1 glycoside hydrolase family 32 protein [Microbacterium sp. IEGM 1404]